MREISDAVLKDINGKLIPCCETCGNPLGNTHDRKFVVNLETGEKLNLFQRYCNTCKGSISQYCLDVSMENRSIVPNRLLKTVREHTEKFEE